jgi:hypothetical protein
MNKIENSQEEKWVLCHNNADIFHISYVGIGVNLSSSQPFLEKFDTEDLVIERIKAINPDYKVRSLRNK